MNRYPVRGPVIFSLLVTLLLCPVSGRGDEGGDHPSPGPAPDTGNISPAPGAGDDIRMLFAIISWLGIDISYGTEGDTVFSMVNASLFQVVDDLSSGNPDGMYTNPLIREFMRYLGIDPSSFAVHPGNETPSMRAVDRFMTDHPTDR